MSARKQAAIVMVEDDEGHARLIERNIRRAGVTNPILHYTTVQQALSQLDRIDCPMLLLLDLNLPDGSGTDVLLKMKPSQALKRAPVIVLTTADDKDEIRRCYDLGCNVYITKPVDYQAFSGAIRQLGLFLSVIRIPDAR